MKNALTMLVRIEECWLWAFRVDEQFGRTLVKDPIEPVIYTGFAFFNVVVCRLSHLRPKPLPAFLGVGYWHVAYRMYAHCRGTQGLYFLHNESSSRLVATVGKALSHFDFQPAKVSASTLGVRVDSRHPLAASTEEGDPGLATGSPFSNATEADAFLRYPPAALYTDEDRPKIMRIGRVEDEFRAAPITSHIEASGFLQPYDAVLERAYRLAPIDYEWRRAEDIP